jgi:dephospho-CoA kinase
MNKLVCVVGMTGSGKSIVSDYLVEKGFSYLRFGQLTMDIIKERGLEVSEDNEKSIREGLRAEHGMAAYAKLNITKFDELLEKGNVVGDGLYSWSEYKVLKEKYQDNLIIVAVYAPPKLRYSRLEKRILAKEDKEMRNRATTKEKSKARDYAEIENIEKGGPIAMADYTIINTFTVEYVRGKLDEILGELNE